MYKIITLSVVLILSHATLFAKEAHNQFHYIKPVSVEVAPPLKSTLMIAPQQKNKNILIKKIPNLKKLPHQKQTLNIHFNHASANLNADAKKHIKDLVSYLQKNKDTQVVIYGYAEKNEHMDKELAQKRARAVTKELNANGIKFTRLTAIGTNIHILESAPKREGTSQIEILLIK